jgi:hypothetical protein
VVDDRLHDSEHGVNDRVIKVNDQRWPVGIDCSEHAVTGAYVFGVECQEVAHYRMVGRR